MYRPIILAALCYLLQACSSSGPGPETKKETSVDTAGTFPTVSVELKPGIVIPRVACLKDATQSYCLYLPSNYSSSKVYPILYFFDSHASGSLPVEKYHELAERYGFIIAGSN